MSPIFGAEIRADVWKVVVQENDAARETRGVVILKSAKTNIPVLTEQDT
ncbi:hypothetical protein [Streptomyces sp. H27-D2]|nr:hypothetical protein [Streptomyces sp. H27-D2]MEC4019486.1 hypothetical protein [Streptomyces sp. H27-D2]